MYISWHEITRGVRGRSRSICDFGVEDQLTTRRDAVRLGPTIIEALAGASLSTNRLPFALIISCASGSKEIGRPDARDPSVVCHHGMLDGVVDLEVREVPFNGDTVAAGRDSVNLVVDTLLTSHEYKALGPEWSNGIGWEI